MKKKQVLHEQNPMKQIARIETGIARIEPNETETGIARIEPNETETGIARIEPNETETGIARIEPNETYCKNRTQ